MAVSSRALVELVLLGPTNDRRQLQDSPVLGDVWIAFASDPAAAMDLLITPYREQPAGPVASMLAKRIAALRLPRKKGQEAQVAYLQGLVAARLFFEEVLRVIVPMTLWWREQKVQAALRTFTRKRLSNTILAIIRWAQARNDDSRMKFAEAFADFSAVDRYVGLAGVILWAGQNRKTKGSPGGIAGLAKIKRPDPIVEKLELLFKRIGEDPIPKSAQIYQVSLNRKAMPALERSVPSVKGDAARTLFNVRCDGIKWAILDSGIDGAHPAFKDAKGDRRVINAFDFSNIRKIVSLDNLDTGTPEFRERLDELLAGRDLKRREAARILKALAEDAENDRPIHWELIEPLIKIDPETEPHSGHGTHVAGIIGAYGGSLNRATTGAEAEADAENGAGDSKYSDGMCPDIKLYDFRVLAKTVQDTEFAIIAALQYIRYLNERHSYITVHGANLSLSIPHDVRNFACGRTPICNECEGLVESGVVVVAAAGNLGYQRFETKEGSFEGYTAFSITDPGNADGVITVGATHRFKPHTYGVSFFSSRGPTGDGRLKPDLVAPGERIQSCLPKEGWGELDGTSMAAPHVSGAAAMLMARYTELIGEPRRIKRILCESATDLGRERSFQGNGMLDVLRAFQKI